MRKLPYIIGNIAMSLDGKIALRGKCRYNISCDEDFFLRDQIRSWVDGVLIGGQTLISDNPSLLLKDDVLLGERIDRGLSEQPAGIAVCGSRGPSQDSKFFSAEKSRRIILAGCDFSGEYSRCEVYKSEQPRLNITWAVEKLYSLNIKTILAEGGGTLLFNMLKEGVMTEFYVSIHPIIIGGSEAPTPFDGEGFSENEVKQVTVIDRIPLSDGGATYHCTVGNVKAMTEYKDNKFKFLEVAT